MGLTADLQPSLHRCESSSKRKRFRKHGQFRKHDGAATSFRRTVQCYLGSTGLKT